MIHDDDWRSNGDPIRGAKCPKCKQEAVVYNGNYWCSECPWIMGENRTVTNDRIVVAYLRQRRDREGATPEERVAMDFHLDEILDRRLA
jgi:hypothetical protein